MDIIKSTNLNQDLFFKCAQFYEDKEWLKTLNWRQRNMVIKIIFENEDYEMFKRKIEQIK